MNKIELYRLVRAANNPARHRNRPIPPTPKEQVIARFRGSSEVTSTGRPLTVGEILAKIKP